MVLSLVSFSPAVVVLYFLLGEFEGYFKDNKALFMMILGLGLGMIIGFFSLYFPIGYLSWALGIIALIEIVKFFILLQKPFRLNHDTTFYGTALGTGIGAMMVFVYSFAAGLVSLDLLTVLLVFFISYNYTLVNASTGAIIGYGCYTGEFWKYLSKGFILSAIHGSMMTFVWSFRFGRTGILAVLTIGGVYGTVLIFYVYNNIFPKTIPEEMKEIKE
ncbi:MAG: hypothetical protein KGY76_01400 [Candidatus Thermoplasmatota archaeon]|nr:hypothetical protein [Candidatus Thermoplasmatota archaeon]